MSTVRLRAWVRSVAAFAAFGGALLGTSSFELQRALGAPGDNEGTDAITAESLFDHGRALMLEGRYAAACAEFETSHKLDPAVGTLLNLGDCYEHLEKTASAWARFREAASMAMHAGQRDREEEAIGRARALEPRLSRLDVHADRNEPADIRVIRDGVELPRAAWGVPIVVDPGVHSVEVRRGAIVVWKRDVAVAEKSGKGTVVRLDVPRAPSDVSPRREKGADVRIIGAVTAGVVGVGAITVGTVLALSARSQYADARAACSANGCPSSSVDSSHEAGRRADFATLSFVVGGALLATGAVLWWRASSDDRRPSLASRVTQPAPHRAAGWEIGAAPSGVSLRLRF